MMASESLIINDSNKRDLFPIAIFLDTNILDSIPENLKSGDLSGLVEDAEKIGTKVYIPDVVAREWLKHRMNKFIDSVENYLKERNNILKYFSEMPEFELTVEGFRKNVYKPLVSRLKKCGCRLLGPPKTTISKLTRRAVWQKAPFRNSNKGFKDELVVLSMLKLYNHGWNYKTYILVTRDNDFPEENLKKRFAEYEVNFERVNSLRDARKLLDEKLSITWKQEKMAREAEAKRFLSMYWENISKAVERRIEEKGVSWLTLYLSGKDDIHKDSDIKKVVKYIPIEIQSVDVGIEDEMTHEIPVTISVKTKLSLEVYVRTWLYNKWFSKIGIEEQSFDSSPTYKTELSIIDIERLINCYAVVKRADNGEFTELQLVDMRPDYRKSLEEIEVGRETQ